MWGSLVSGASSLVSGLAGGSAAPVAMTPDHINVAPVGVNFGAMLQPFDQGSPENGGYGVVLPSRYGGSSTTPSLKYTPSEKAPVFNLPLIACAALGGLALFMFMR